jgi:hypothetical protein
MADLTSPHAAIPALTLWQPWATLVAEGLKPFEFRSWPAPSRLIGQRIAIHAGARPVRRDEIDDLMSRLDNDEWRSTGLTDRAKSIDLLYGTWRGFRTRGPNSFLPLASVVCTAVLGQPIRNAELATALGVPELFGLNDSDRDEHSNWGWPLTEIRRLQPPTPARGAQGFWKWTPDG